MVEGHNLVKGNLLNNMIRLLIPLFLTSILAQVDNIINAVWISNLIGNEGVSTVINCNPLIYFTTSISAGIAVATGVLVARLYASKNEEGLKTLIGTSYVLNAIICFTLAFIMIRLSPILLNLLGTPIEILEQTKNYFNVYMYGFSFTFILTTIMGSMRSIGNSKTPLYLIGLASLINIILAPLLISGYGIFPKLGITGTTWANIISSFVCTIIALIYVNIKSRLLRIYVLKLRLNLAYCGYILKLGIPVMIENMAIALIIMFEVHIANRTGLVGSSIYGAVSKLENISIVLGGAYRLMASVTVSQFIGGNMKESAKRVMTEGLKLTILPIFIIVLMVFVFPRPIISLFINDEVVIDQAIEYLMIVGFAFILLPIRQLLGGFITGTGHTSYTLLTVIFACVVEFILTSCLLKVHTNSLLVLGIGILAWVLTEMIINTIFYLRGTWKNDVLKRGILHV